ncbi:MAG: Rpn family recombination-promoting nuclease/putative transposase [Clostridiales bacterium]|nr:Rpn family recombination-promoting nuclease/putative transposase [Clostridiales bacterium]
MAKDFQKLTIKDSFMFAAVMNDPETCRLLLERVLGMQILDVGIVTEKMMNYRPDYHGVRLDALAIENGTERRFNVEMQVKEPQDLFRRCRFYHSSMDMTALPPSLDYGNLADCYVIFICDFDPFESGLYRYTCQMTCRENGEILADGSQTILLSTKGKNRDEEPQELVSFLEYVGHPELPTSDEYAKLLADKIANIKRNRTWEVKYMLLKEMLRDEREEGREEGRGEGAQFTESSAGTRGSAGGYSPSGYE